MKRIHKLCIADSTCIIAMLSAHLQEWALLVRGNGSAAGWRRELASTLPPGYILPLGVPFTQSAVALISLSVKQRMCSVEHNEHWLGLDYINALSQQPGKVCQLRVDMMSCKEELAYLLYDTFKIGNERELYQISLGNFTGNVGDAFRGTEEFGDQNGHNFTTYDRDNDACNVCITGGHAYTNCARDIGYSGWWFSHCGMANLNGEWHTKETSQGWLLGVYWGTWD
ncbi:6-phosphofructokinase, liver type [Platysternon megacephalum]|uniref:6-phosphofructokinase, liver type n=1 Tax=Platysternon megacephalum TaxID=55544 RepID=A0A4D9EQV8_9SAUR|nr:6-phosphofructokinase, liver type [Platysternon megacephalum]